MTGDMFQEFGPYRLEHLIGRGGMGEVYRAFDRTRGRTVALKRLPIALAGDPEYQARFRRESALAAQLSEPHIIPIHDFGEIDGRLYIDMRLVEGVDLATVIRAEGPMAPGRAVAILGQVGAALDAAHAAGLVHRDVKPSNVLVRGRDEDEFAYLIDFGIAREAAGATSGPALTVTGATLGTLDYMAPERFENRPVDGRVDVYSLACVLFELLTGAAPFHGRTPIGMVHAHTSLDAPRPSAQVPGLPTGLDDVVQRGMAKRPEHRYPTAGALVAAARAVLRGAPTPTATPHVPAPRLAASRTPVSHTPAPHTPVPQAWAPHNPAAQTSAPHTPAPSPRAIPVPRTPVPQTLVPQKPTPRAPAPQARAPQAAAPLSLRKTPRPTPPPTPPPVPAASGWRSPPQAAPPPAQWPRPTARPTRPASTVVALVLQLVSGGAFLVGSLFGLIGGAPLALVLMLVAGLYITCAVQAFGGRGWARVTLTVINALFGALCLIALPITLAESTNTPAEKAGAVFGLLVLIGMAIACTLPMFSRSARRLRP